MDTVTFQDFPNIDSTTTTYAIITHDDGSFTSMPKSVYDTLASESANDPAGNK